MPGKPRSLPDQPSLRYLKLEARRRVAAGEFPALHDAQTAIAREHGLPSWSALKQLVGSQPPQPSHALAQLRWIIDRFKDAAEPGWAPPDDAELRQHFAEGLLAAVPAAELIKQITGAAADMHGTVLVEHQAPLSARVLLGSREILAAVEADPPHRLTGLQAFPVGRRITDPRTAEPPPIRTDGDVPAAVAGIAEEVFAELGLAALVLAGGRPGIPVWVAAKGWADLGGAEVLDTSHRFPALGVTALVTATAVLRLIAEGRFGLDDPASGHLRTVRLADDSITVRELLAHTGGVDSPAPGDLLDDSAPDLAALTGPVVGCSGPRGEVRPSNGGYAVLGQLIADVTGSPYDQAVTRLVLKPLGMTRSSFPARSADLGPDIVTSYDVSPDGAFVPLPARIATIPAAGGLCAAAADIVRLGAGWASLLPASLALEALTPQTAPGPGGRQMGLGWLISPRGDIAVHTGAGPGATAILLVRIHDSQAQAAMTNRLIPLDSVVYRVLRSWTGLAH